MALQILKQAALAKFTKGLPADGGQILVRIYFFGECDQFTCCFESGEVAAEGLVGHALSLNLRLGVHNSV